METAEIKAEVQSAISLVNKIDQGERWTIKTFTNEVEILKRVMIEAPPLEQWSEDIYSEIKIVLELLG